LAKARRELELQRYRVDERERQRAWREAGAGKSVAEVPPKEPCHAPASAGKLAEVREEVLRFWDGQIALSRARLQRALPGILRSIERSVETRAGP
jgi:hypothetical protein